MSWIFIVESVRSKFLQDFGNYGISALEVHWTDYIYLKSLFTVYRVSITLPLSLLNPEPDSTKGQLISCWRVKVGIAAAGPAIGKQSSCKGPVFGLEPASTQNLKKQKLWFFLHKFVKRTIFWPQFLSDRLPGRWHLKNLLYKLWNIKFLYIFFKYRMPTVRRPNTYASLIF